jgi:hypothetical protein
VDVVVVAVLVVVLVDVGVLEVVVLDGVELVVVVLLVVELLVVLDVVLRQSLAASCWIVEAPCSRFRVSVGLTDGGRLMTELLNVVTASSAVLHWPEPTALAT